ncbi:gamma-glutamylcyclotransferase family protein [Conexibacter sp. JD483]|uniref:gamma-glutamylcyclotransferase family protein n=1 Tax=unclassified Conexibacter TaxID=2627773 RepID=UPI00271BF18B|nr:MULTISPECIES: gamma-glutamylcyclotransferase family protein [unclassified Conexibacter]MDO8186288.1 gamma-glutamylcyclotransferase family protein [Conexibacter sp. CPCC 205706]MDO8197493.1 gamma-glutamylcyclotransferase family protein [Conexibacter sp. CPCC 205762]MDR9370276.1 gamma-glutamylcyclotransferase family protein [Conexibacter sp. JD483]
MSTDWVFGYGSLTADARDGHAAVLRGYRRRWGVAMDNSRDLPGYKWYRQRATGERPAVFVAFLDLVADRDGSAVNGLCLPVDAPLLERLDARERNYERVDVTTAIEAPRGRVWTYVGSRAARARLARGLRERRAVVSQEYVDDVEHGFRRLGDGQLDAYRACTEPLPPGCETLSLERIDLPG